MQDIRDLFPDAVVFNIDIGDRVVCDTCAKEYTGLPDSGGIFVGSKAICPECAPAYEEGLRKCDELHLLRSRCPADKSFERWVLEDLRCK
jgi:hypothetical protein